MDSFSIKFGKLFFSSFFALLPLNQSSLLASDILLANNDEDIEEVRVKRVNKKGNLVVRFCSKLKDYKGYVEVDNQIFKEANTFKNIIFIVGMPRSGSTLLENILSLNHEVTDMGEITFLEESLKDIDNIEDWELAESMYELNLKKHK